MIANTNGDSDGGIIAQVRQIVDEVFAMTSALVLTGEPELEEQEMESYIKMVEEREPLIAKLTEIHQSHDPEKLEAIIDSDDFAAIRQIIQDIGSLDERHTSFMTHLSNDAKKAYKDVKHGQRIHAGYTGSHLDAGSGKFDVKQ